VSAAIALGYASQTAFAIAFRRLTGDCAHVNSNPSTSTSIALGQQRTRFARIRHVNGKRRQ
jgi:hypothetical protein